MVFWDVINKESVLCRIHSSCITWDVFHSLKCDCGDQLDFAMNIISEQSGIVIYLDQEGRNIGLINKIKAYALQDQWLDTVEANEKLWLPVDNRNYDSVVDILNHLNIKSIKLLTNNPDKCSKLADLWINITERVAIQIEANKFNKNYLQTKKDKMDHML